MSKFADAVPVLMYHHVTPNPGLVTVAPETFEDHMAFLAKDGYTALTADQFVDFLQGSFQAPRRSVLITFDDGYLDNYVYAYPILKSHGLHATIFCVTSWIADGPRRNHAGQGAALPTCPNHSECKHAIAAGQSDSVVLRWSEIETMSRDEVIEIHSHTHTHTRWDKAIADVAVRNRQLTADLLESRQTLRARLGHDSRHLCWPQGYFDAAYQAVASNIGFIAQYTTMQRVNTRATAPESIGRTVAKDLPARWLANRLFIYSRPWLGSAYHRLRGSV